MHLLEERKSTDLRFLSTKKKLDQSELSRKVTWYDHELALGLFARTNVSTIVTYLIGVES